MHLSFPPPPCCSCLIPSLAATSRRARSFSSPLTSSNLRLITSSSLMPHSLSHLSSSCYLYFLTSPKFVTPRSIATQKRGLPSLELALCCTLPRSHNDHFEG